MSKVAWAAALVLMAGGFAREAGAAFLVLRETGSTTTTSTPTGITSTPGFDGRVFQDRERSVFGSITYAAPVVPAGESIVGLVASGEVRAQGFFGTPGGMAFAIGGPGGVGSASFTVISPDSSGATATPFSVDLSGPNGLLDNLRAGRSLNVMLFLGGGIDARVSRLAFTVQTAAVVPEPSSLMLCGLALMGGLGAWARRRVAA